MSPSGQARVPVALLPHTISARLLQVLCGQAWTSAVASKSPITIESFLVALAGAYPGEISRFFVNAENLSRLAESRREPDLKIKDETIGEANSHGIHPMLMIKLDDALVQLLWRAAKISCASGRGPADLPELMGALSLDDACLRQLETNTGTRLKNYLGPPR